MFNIGDKVKITAEGMGMAFNGHEETVFDVFDVKHQEKGEYHYEIQLALDGFVFANKYNKNVTWFKGRRFALVKNAIIKDAPKCVDAEGQELKVGDLVSIVARKVGQYRITKFDLVEGRWDARLEYVQSKYVHRGSNDPDDNDPPIRGFDKWFKSGSYPASHVYKVDPAVEGFIGFYYVRDGKDLLFCVARSVADQKKMKLQIVGSLNGEDQSYIGDIIQEFPANLQYLNYNDQTLNIIAQSQLEGAYGKRINNVAEDAPVDEEKLQKELAELLKPLIEDNNNKETFYARRGPADFTVVNHHNNKLYSKCSFGEPCHYDLKKAGYNNINARSRPYTVVQWLGRINALLQDECKEGALATAAWIVTGPWKKAFKPKQDISKGYVEVNVDRTGNEIGSALLAIRQLTEFAGQSITIAKLLKLGIDMPIAWLLSFRVSWNEAKKCFTSGGLEDRGHTMLHSSSRMDEVLRFLKKGLPKEVVENRSYRNWQGYDNIYSVMDEEITSYGRANDKDSVREWFHNHLKFEVTGRGFDQKSEAKPEHLLEVAALIKARMGEIK